MSLHGVLSLLAGVGLLLYGLELVEKNLQSLAGGRLRRFIDSAAQNRLRGVATGTVFTALIQSSSAATAMLVGLTSAGFLSLPQAAALILGADIGTTITVQLIAFQIQDYALGIIALGFFLRILRRHRQIQFLGAAILGFGFVFFSLSLVSQAAAELRPEGRLAGWISSAADYPVLGLLAAAVVSALFQSSAATIGLSLALAQQEVITLSAALPIILGANLGTCAMALVASIGRTLEARRVAVAHLLFKLIGILVAFPLLGPFESVISASAESLPRQIANAHTFFNLALAAILLPLIPRLIGLVRRVVPETAALQPWQPRYLDAKALDTPPLALALASREALRMAHIAREMYADTIRILGENNLTLVEKIETRENWLDNLNREIKLYLTKLSSQQMADETSTHEVALISIIGDLENIGDILHLNLAELGKKKIYQGLRFSEAGLREVTELHAFIGRNFDGAIEAFASSDPALAEKVVRAKAEIKQREFDLRATHIQRLHQGLVESIETSSIHLDLLTNLIRVNHHITRIAHAVREQK